MQESILMLAMTTPAVLFAVTLYWVDRVRRREALFRWACQARYRLIAFKQPILTEVSPFRFAVSRSQQVFRVEVEDQDGNRRSGWVRLGNAWRGLASRSVEERWESS